MSHLDDSVFDYLPLIRENLCDFVSDPDEPGSYYLVFGKYRLSSQVFSDSFSAFEWIQNHPVEIALSVYSICREIDLQSDAPSQS